jgi:cation diffusion facilitator family transporter
MEPHSHIFLGEGHEHAERRTWAVIWLCGAMMALEIAGGLLFGSIALVADGLHMSTHAGALLLAALAYRYARRHATDARFTFGTGKLGDLAGFTSAIVLAMIALLIGFEAANRLLDPVPIAFAEAIPIACLGLAVNVVSAWLLGGGHHDHQEHGHRHHDRGHDHGHGHGHGHEHTRDAAHSDNNMRAAIVHVMADAAVSVLVIVGLLLARAFGWLWMDPLAGIVGAVVIASWAYGLVRDTGCILLDMNPDRQLTEQLRQEIETDGDRLTDLHVWRLGPGHLGAVLSVVTGQNRKPQDYHDRLRHFASLSHITVEVQPR